MARLFLNVQNADEQAEARVIDIIKPELNYICYNPIRASILHLMIKTPELNYSLSVEELAKRLGKRHSVIIHHLEKLNEWNLVEVVKFSKYGEKQRRKIWGLNLKLPNLVTAVYGHLLKTFFTVSELNQMCNVNKNVRVNGKKIGNRQLK